MSPFLAGFTWLLPPGGLPALAADPRSPPASSAIVFPFADLALVLR